MTRIVASLVVMAGAVLLLGVATPALPTNGQIVIRNSQDPDNPPANFYFTGTLRQPTCSDASIDSAITAAVSGDIVRMASACASFTASIVIPSTKGILFDGNGSTFNSSSTISVAANATKSTRLTNFTYACGGSSVGTPGI